MSNLFSTYHENVNAWQLEIEQHTLQHKLIECKGLLATLRTRLHT